MNTINLNIFDFSDPRSYLRKIYEDCKRVKPKYYTYEKFAEILGFSNKGFVYNYLYPLGKSGNNTLETKKLMPLHCRNISDALKHSPEETSYFLHIVNADQAQGEKEHTYHLKEAAKIRISASIKVITNEQIRYYSQWYHSAIRSLIDIHPELQDPEVLSRQLQPPVTPAQARASIALLQKIGLITISNDGHLRLGGKIINTGKDIPQTIKDRSHCKYIDLAKQAIKEIPPTSRYAVSHTIGVSEETYSEIVKEIESFRATLRNLVDKDKNPTRVYQLELLLFPLSKSNSSTKEKP